MRLELCFFISCYILLITLYCFTEVNSSISEVTQENIALLIVVAVVITTIIIYKILNNTTKADKDEHDT